MKFKQSAVLSSVVAGAAIRTEEAGFLPGMQVLAFVGAPGGAFNGSAILQTSVDGTTWVTAPGASAVTGPSATPQVVTLSQFVRLNVTAFTSGQVQATLVGDID